jgi:hypothetical protein
MRADARVFEHREQGKKREAQTGDHGTRWICRMLLMVRMSLITAMMLFSGPTLNELNDELLIRL